MTEPTRFDGISRRTLLKSGAVSAGAFGLAGCTSGGGSDTTVTTEAESSDDEAVPELDLETLQADAANGIFQANRADSSYVGAIGDGRAIGVAFAEDLGVDDAAEDLLVVQLYDRDRLAVLIGEVDDQGAATLESEENSDFGATAELVVADDEVTGTVTYGAEEPTEFTANVATGDAGVYWARGTDENPDDSADWVVLSDGSQWGCACVPPYTSICCSLVRS